MLSRGTTLIAVGQLPLNGIQQSLLNNAGLTNAPNCLTFQSTSSGVYLYIHQQLLAPTAVSLIPDLKPEELSEDIFLSVTAFKMNTNVNPGACQSSLNSPVEELRALSGEEAAVRTQGKSSGKSFFISAWLRLKFFRRVSMVNSLFSVVIRRRWPKWVSQ